jgi:GT2 family glycosyltransferase
VVRKAKSVLNKWRTRLAPPQSVRDQVLEGLLSALHARSPRLLWQACGPLAKNLRWHLKVWRRKIRLYLNPPKGEVINVPQVMERPPVVPYQATVDVVVCVHNALEDVQRCLESVLKYLRPVDRLLIVDDGSDTPTRDYLRHFAAEHQAKLLRNEAAQGYTIAANRGLHQTRADYVVLLNSDTIVTEGWLDRLIACAETDDRFGIIGPLSNTASWQSIPEIEDDGDWAENPLPSDVTVEDMGRLVAQYSGRLYVPMPLLNGFCLCIRRSVLEDVGYFDEQNFGQGYGEEDDYVLRARKKNWQPVLADDAFVYHAQSRSYSNERRRELGRRAGVILARKHGAQIIEAGVQFCREDRVLEGIRARSKTMFTRQDLTKKGRERFAGRRILFLLPALGPGGGANVVLDEASALHKMGIDVAIFNLPGYQNRFEQSYPELSLPVIYEEPEQLVNLGSDYDAIIATANTTVSWLTSLHKRKELTLGYYVQGFEPLMYPSGSEAAERALRSYTVLPNVRMFTKTAWTRDMVKQHVGVEPALVGASVNLDLFRPRPRDEVEWPERPLRVAAMVRSGTPYRAPEITMTLLERLCRKHTGIVEAWIFGIDLDDPYFDDVPQDFAWKLAGVLNRRQMAYFLNQVDIFVDFSIHQAMGLTAMEAMAAGNAVIVPQNGGATLFARHGENALVVDTASESVCWKALLRLVEDHALRTRLQQRALSDICTYPPERSAFAMLSVLFGTE